jgi:hypothetical protein
LAIPAKPLVSWAQRFQTDLRRTEVDAVILGVRGFVDHRRRVQQGLGWNAADVEADAAERGVAFHQHGVEAEIGAAKRRGISAGAGAEHQHAAFDIGLAPAGCGSRGRGRRCRRGRHRSGRR